MLPTNFVKNNLKKQNNFKLFGVNIVDFTRDELIASCIAGWIAYDDTLEQSLRDNKFLREINKIGDY